MSSPSESESPLDEAIQFLEQEAKNAGRVFQATANTAISLLAALKKMERGEAE